MHVQQFRQHFYQDVKSLELQEPSLAQGVHLQSPTSGPDFSTLEHSSYFILTSSTSYKDIKFYPIVLF